MRAGLLVEQKFNLEFIEQFTRLNLHIALWRQAFPGSYIDWCWRLQNPIFDNMVAMTCTVQSSRGSWLNAKFIWGAPHADKIPCMHSVHVITAYQHSYLSLLLHAQMWYAWDFTLFTSEDRLQVSHSYWIVTGNPDSHFSPLSYS